VNRGDDLDPPEPERTEPAEVVDPDVVNRVAADATRVLEERFELHFRSFHAGPLPSPETLAAYDERFPGLGNQIVAWTDSEIRTRQRIQTHATDSVVRVATRAQYIGILIVLLAFAAIFTGKEIAGLVVLAPIILAFGYGQLTSKPSPVGGSQEPSASQELDQAPK